MNVWLSGMVDSDGKVVIIDLAALSEHDSDGTTEVTTTSSKKTRNSSKTVNGNISNSESR